MNTTSEPGPAVGVPPMADPERLPRLHLGRWAVLTVLIVLIAAAAGIVPRLRHAARLRAETQELAVPSVIVASPVPNKAAAGLSLPAEVKALVEAPIYARANGYIHRWLVDIGAQVEPGQLLAEIDTPELDQELAQAQAQLNQAEAALQLAKITASRWTDLLKTASVSEQEAAEKESDLALKSATVEAARANVRRLQELHGFAKVMAPFAGTITVRRIDVGQLVNATGGTELFRLAQTGTLRIYVRVPQANARGIRIGDVAEVTVPEIPGRVFQAKVVRTSGAMDTQSRTLLTELELPNPHGELLAGSYAQVVFADSKIEVPLTLPSNSLLFRAEGPQVGVVDSTGKVELRNVKLGRDFGPTIEVLDGVSPADRVIVNPSDSLVTGAVVRVADDSRPLAGK